MFLHTTFRNLVGSRYSDKTLENKVQATKTRKCIKSKSTSFLTDETNYAKSDRNATAIAPG